VNKCGGENRPQPHLIEHNKPPVDNKTPVTKPDNKPDNKPTALIAGIAGGVVLLIIVAIAITVSVMKKRKLDHDSSHWSKKKSYSRKPRNFCTQSDPVQKLTEEISFGETNFFPQIQNL
jgi:hypothetical protein